MPAKSMPPQPTGAQPLTARAERFAHAYVSDPTCVGNATAAARKAGYSGTYARQQAYKLLQDRRVTQRVDELRTELADQTAAKPANIIEAYRRMAMLDATRLLTPDEDSTDERPTFRYKRPDELTEEERGMLADLTVHDSTRKDGTRVQRFTYKAPNRKDALDSLARCHGMFRDRVEHEHTHKVRAVFEFVARDAEHGEPIARLNAQRPGRLFDGRSGAPVEIRNRGGVERSTDDQ